jgi:serine/threonine-protein kinase
MIGRVLDGRYRIDARIARGGMATVFRAHDLRLDRECAVKVMHADLGDDHDFAARFVREAHSAARLSHPNVVAVNDQGDDEGVPFLVMEHVPGRTLRDVIRDESPMAPERALALLEPVLAALAEAHRSGLIHRDVKPENVLIADDGRVKVADFGLARAFDTNTAHTATGGLLIGTVSYLAPELIVNGRSDPRSDVYAAGVLLFEMLTGRKPHEGEGAIQVAFKHVNEDVPAPSTRVDQPIPAYVDALVLRATARERERRQADAKVFLRQVRRVRAALDAGDRDDPELTTDLLPVVLPVADEVRLPADDPDDPTLEAPVVEAGSRAPETRADLPPVEELLDADEPTTVIGPTVTPVPRARTEGEIHEVAAVGATARAGGGATGTPPAPERPAGGGTGAPPGRPRGRRPDGPAPQRRPGRLAAPPSGGGADTGRPATRPARRRTRRGPLLLLLVVLLTALTAYAGWWFGIGRYASTPGIINLPLAVATEKVEAAGLDLEVTERTFSETVTAGSVVSTDPTAGSKILEGGTVEVVVSRGPERYAVPRLAGRAFADVEPLLDERNLALGEVRRIWHERVEKGKVVIADPRAGTELRPGSTVDVTVSKGREPIKIPDLTGRDAERAQKRLTGLGFEVEVTERHDAEVPEGRVVSQNPTRGTGHRGDTIDMVVSLGPVMVDVPDLRTKSVAEATEALEEVGLRIAVERTEFYIALDRVVRQDPGGDETIPEGDTVTVYIV